MTSATNKSYSEKEHKGKDQMELVQKPGKSKKTHTPHTR